MHDRAAFQKTSLWYQLFPTGENTASYDGYPLGTGAVACK